MCRYADVQICRWKNDKWMCYDVQMRDVECAGKQKMQIY